VVGGGVVVGGGGGGGGVFGGGGGVGMGGTHLMPAQLPLILKNCRFAGNTGEKVIKAENDRGGEGVLPNSSQA